MTETFNFMVNSVYDMIRYMSDDKIESVNPFYHRPQWTLYQCLKIFFLTFTILPLRLLIMGCVFLLLYPSVCVAYWFGSKQKRKFQNKDPSNCVITREIPLSGWIYYHMLPWLDFLNRTLLWACGFLHIKIIGEPCTQTKILVCAPHSTFADSIVVMYPHLKTIVAKKAAQHLFALGTLVSFLQPIWVERDELNSRRNAIQGIINRMNDGDNVGTLNQWPQICIFPEGTCTNRKALIYFKKGAFYPGFPVQPVCIRYPNDFDCLTWTWDGPNTLLVIWWSLCQPYLKIEIEYLPVYHPNESEKKDGSLFAENVRTLMARHLKIPKSNSTYEDCKNAWKINEAVQKFQTIHKAKEPSKLLNSLNFLCATLLINYYKTKNYTQQNSTNNSSGLNEPLIRDPALLVTSNFISFLQNEYQKDQKLNKILSKEESKYFQNLSQLVKPGQSHNTNQNNNVPIISVDLENHTPEERIDVKKVANLFYIINHYEATQLKANNIKSVLDECNLESNLFDDIFVERIISVPTLKDLLNKYLTKTLTKHDESMSNMFYFDGLNKKTN